MSDNVKNNKSASDDQSQTINRRDLLLGTSSLVAAATIPSAAQA
jgi:hypothetical protein